MVHVRDSLVRFGWALAVLSLAVACDRIHDNQGGGGSTISDLVAESVSPNAVQSDVTADPNGPPPDDKVTVTLKNTTILITGGDILVTSFDINCASGTLTSLNNPTALPIAAGASSPVQITIATGAFKELNQATLLAAGADFCDITFKGTNLNGDAVSSAPAVVGVTFVDI
jgi:hypothetical protein